MTAFQSLKPTNAPLFVGIDVGTSGCRAIAIDSAGNIHGRATVIMPEPLRRGASIEQHPSVWWNALVAALEALFVDLNPGAVRAVSVDATSGTVLLSDRHGTPLGPALMYNDARAAAEAKLIAEVAPKSCAAHGPSSSLAKLMWLQRHYRQQRPGYALHQADWLLGKLCGKQGVSDANNCLKMGYDPIAQQWPEWLKTLEIELRLVPHVLTPGDYLGEVTDAASEETGLIPGTRIIAGTTDSTAAFIATGACRPGEAVTSLGSTLVLKVLSETPVFAPEYGVYSQPLGELWLVGGGSNSGGAVLRQIFTPKQIDTMTGNLKPDEPTGMDYYPLCSPGERFPVCDPNLQPRLTPRPTSDVHFFQGILESMARIEAQGYQLLAHLGAPYPTRVFSVGGGARNLAWARIRAKMLNVPLLEAPQHEAAFGAAKLVRASTSD